MNKKKQKEKPVFDPIESTVKLTSYHEFLGHPFLRDYKINTKVNQFDSVDRVFNKERSVFKDWRIDRPKIMADGFLEEMGYCKIAGVVKEEEELEQITKYMTDNVAFLKTIFIIRSS